MTSDIVFLAVRHADLTLACLASLGHMHVGRHLLRRDIDVRRGGRELRVCLRVAVEEVPVAWRKSATLCRRMQLEFAFVSAGRAAHRRWGRVHLQELGSECLFPPPAAREYQLLCARIMWLIPASSRCGEYTAVSRCSKVRCFVTLSYCVSNTTWHRQHGGSRYDMLTLHAHLGTTTLA